MYLCHSQSPKSCLREGLKKKMEFSIFGWVGGSKGGNFPFKKMLFPFFFGGGQLGPEVGYIGLEVGHN